MVERQLEKEGVGCRTAADSSPSSEQCTQTDRKQEKGKGENDYRVRSCEPLGEKNRARE